MNTENQIVDEAIAARIAHVIGDQSGAAFALKELKRQRDAGRDAWLTRQGTTWCVFIAVPWLETHP